MRQNENDSSAKQEEALNALAAGEAVTQAAADAGVHRSTVHRWQSNPDFVACLISRRTGFRSEAEARFYQLRKKAIDVIDHSLDEGDARTALAVL